MYSFKKKNPAYLKKNHIAPVAIVEGYNVYYFKTYYWWSGFSGELVDKSNIYVYGNSSKADKDEIRDFVSEHIDEFIEEDLINRGLKRPYQTKSVLDLDSFSYANPRRDIDDEPSVKLMKRKYKSSRIERTYSTPYHGEVSRNIIGMRGVSADGRLITIEPREDYGLRDRN